MALVGLCVLNPLTAPQDASPRQPPSAAPTQEKHERTLLFVGDVMLSRGVGARMKAEDDWNLPFEEIAGTLRSADLRFCNLECPISDRGHNLHHLYSFRADPTALEGLKTAGFNVVSQANNHAYDWGPEALLDSLDRLRAAGIRPAGAGQNALAARTTL
jgi:poly-gamma-glutamate synthesis protein (capsule biosynthesis protein)